MAKYKIYNPEGEIICESTSATMTGKWMEDANVIVDVNSPYPLEFTYGCYIDFMGDRYVMYEEPGAEKVARKNTYGGAFQYKGLKFENCSRLLKNIRMFDTVLDENNAAYNVNPVFSIFCEDINDFKDIIEANINREYRLYEDADVDNEGSWKVQVASGNYATNVSVEISNISVFDALKFIATKFMSSYTIRCDSEGVNVITIGSYTNVRDLVGFEYGKDNGLVSVEKVLNTDNELITSVRAYGSSNNMPDNFYKNSYRPDFQIPYFQMCPHFLADGTLKHAGLARYYDEEYDALADSCNEYNAFAFIVNFNSLESAAGPASLKNKVPDHVFLFIPVYFSMMQDDNNFIYYFRNHPNVIMKGTIYGPERERIDFKGMSNEANAALQENAHPFNYFHYYRIIDSDGLVDFNCTSKAFGATKFMWIELSQLKPDNTNRYTVAEWASLLYDSPIVVTNGILKKYTYSHKQWWLSPYPLLPQALAVNNLMLPGFNWYLACRSKYVGTDDILDIKDVELIPEIDFVNPFTVNKVYNSNGKLDHFVYEDNTIGFPCYFIPNSTTKFWSCTETALENKHNITERSEKHLVTMRDVKISVTDTDENGRYFKDIRQHGLRETVLFFDGSSEEFPEIKPTIQGLTASRANKCGYNVKMPQYDNGLLDEILYATQIEDNGSLELVGSSINTNLYPSSFYIYLKDIGFDIKDYLSNQSAEILMESGDCGSRSFELVDSNLNPEKVTIYIKNSTDTNDVINVKNPDDNYNAMTICNSRDVKLEATAGYTAYEAWKVHVKRKYDETLQRWFPNCDYQVSGTLRNEIRQEDIVTGIYHSDRIALINIEMPQAYIDIASQKLYESAYEYLLKYNHERYSYNIKISSNFAARNIKVKTALREGNMAIVKDDDLGANIGVNKDAGQEIWYIDSVTVKDDANSKLPEYNVVLKQEKELSAIQKINSKIVYLQTQLVSNTSDISSSRNRIQTVSSSVSSISDEKIIEACEGTYVKYDNLVGSMSAFGNDEYNVVTQAYLCNYYLRNSALQSDYVSKSYLQQLIDNGTLGSGGSGGGQAVLPIDRLDSNDATVPLSANMGRELKSLIDTKADASSLSNYFTKSEVNNTFSTYATRIGTLETTVNSLYSKEETDALFSKSVKAYVISESGAVSTANVSTLPASSSGTPFFNTSTNKVVLKSGSRYYSTWTSEYESSNELSNTDYNKLGVQIVVGVKIYEYNGTSFVDITSSSSQSQIDAYTKTETDSAIATAKSEAIASSNEYAEGKADTAKSEAIASAKSYTDSKITSSSGSWNCRLLTGAYDVDAQNDDKTFFLYKGAEAIRLSLPDDAVDGFSFKVKSLGGSIVVASPDIETNPIYNTSSKTATSSSSITNYACTFTFLFNSWIRSY